MRRFAFFCSCVLVVLVAVGATVGAPQPVSQDRDLKEYDLASWNCLNKPGGSARTPDGIERNNMKNRSAIDLTGVHLEQLDVPGFLKFVSGFDAMTQGMHRKDITPDIRAKLEPLEKQLVQVTGYLVLAYAGPPEITNCASGDFHDWHLEVAENPIDHPPQPGDPTPIICEITPRTQNAIYKDGIRIQELSAFFRNPPPENTYQATGHPAVKIRVTGFLMWDDEHNGSADVGTAIRTAPPGKFHNPWRKTAWEVHPIIKVERLDRKTTTATAPGAPASFESSPPAASSSPATPANAPPAPTAEATPAPTPTVTMTPPQFVALSQPVKIKSLTAKPLCLAARGCPSFRATTERDRQIHGRTYNIPVSSTDLP